MTGYRVIPAPEALGRVVCRGVSVGAAVVCAGGAGMRVEGSSRMDGILDVFGGCEVCELGLVDEMSCN